MIHFGQIWSKEIKIKRPFLFFLKVWQLSILTFFDVCIHKESFFAERQDRNTHSYRSSNSSLDIAHISDHQHCWSFATFLPICCLFMVGRFLVCQLWFLYRLDIFWLIFQHNLHMLQYDHRVLRPHTSRCPYRLCTVY